MPEMSTGVYCIRNVVNGKRYVGSSAHDLWGRWWVHRSHLRKNHHCNIYLQRAFNKNGESAFEFIILERVCPAKCVEREQYWIDYYQSANPKFGYNRNPKAGSMLGFHHSEETKRLVSEKGRGRKHTEDTKQRISKRMSVVMLGNTVWKGRKHTEEARAKIAAAAVRQHQRQKAERALRLQQGQPFTNH